MQKVLFEGVSTTGGKKPKRFRPFRKAGAKRPLTKTQKAHNSEWMKEWRKRAGEAYLAKRRKKEREDRHQWTPEQRAKRADEKKQREAERRAKGLCPYCGRKAEDGIISCRGCLNNHRRYRIKYAFGITEKEHDAMLASQGDKCAICGRDRNTAKHVRRFHIDHDHATGYVRGILCANCNHLLGDAHDNPDVLRKAADYLEAAKKKERNNNAELSGSLSCHGVPTVRQGTVACTLR